MAIFYKLLASDIQIKEDEASRYAGYRKTGLEEDDRIYEMVKTSCNKLQKVLCPQLVYQEYDLFMEKIAGNEKFLIKFADIQLESKSLGINLSGCKKILLAAGTVGAQVDMMIRRSQQEASAEAAIMQGSGAMFIESFMDKWNEKISAEYLQKGMKSHPRFSPGYGDVPLEFQKEIFRLLPCAKIGLTLMDSLIMAPEKSVTAFVGLE